MTLLSISTQDCKHPEAYRLMKYKCEKCHKVERVYNTRDGITPFIIDCLDCGGMSQHVEWAHDKLMNPNMPQLFPEVPLYERIFVDMPKAVFLVLTMNKVNRIWGDKEIGQAQSIFKTKENAFEHFASEWEEGLPWLVKL